MKTIQTLIYLLLLFLGPITFVNAGTTLAIPPLKERITDLAQLLTTEQHYQLEQKIIQFEFKHPDGSQIAILIIPSLENNSIEEYANNVFEQWKLGNKKADNGILLLISVNDHRLRIEVGYGLEGVLTDLRTKQIINTYLTPHFKSGRYFQGITLALTSINDVLAHPDTNQLIINQKSKLLYDELFKIAIIISFSLLLALVLIHSIFPHKFKTWLKCYCCLLLVATVLVFGYSNYAHYFDLISPIKSMLFVVIISSVFSLMFLFAFFIAQLYLGVPILNYAEKCRKKRSKSTYRMKKSRKVQKKYNVFDRGPIWLTLIIITIFSLLPNMLQFWLCLIGFIVLIIYMFKYGRSANRRGGSGGSGSSGGFSGGGGSSGGGGASGSW